jgi:chromosome segregation ATPase
MATQPIQTGASSPNTLQLPQVAANGTSEVRVDVSTSSPVLPQITRRSAGCSRYDIPAGAGELVSLGGGVGSLLLDVSDTIKAVACVAFLLLFLVIAYQHKQVRDRVALGAVQRTTNQIHQETHAIQASTDKAAAVAAALKPEGKAWDKATAALPQETAQLQQTVLSLTAQCDAFSKENTALKASVADLQRNLEAQSAQFKSLSAAIDKFTQGVQAAHSAQVKLKAAADQVGVGVQGAKDDNKQLSVSIEKIDTTLDKQIGGLIAQIQRAETLHQQILADLTSREAALRHQEERLQQQVGKFTQVDQQFDSSNTQLGALSQKYEQTQRELEKLRSSYRELSEQIAKERAEFAGEREKFAATLKQFQALQQDLSKAPGQLTQATDGLSHSMSQMERMLASIEAQTAKANAAATKTGDL